MKHSVRAWKGLATVAVAMVLGSTPGMAQGSPAGVFRWQGVTLELTDDGRAIVSTASGPLSVGSYRVASDTIVMGDDPGQDVCAGAPGRYEWHVHGDSLRLGLVLDACVYRREALTRSWVRTRDPGRQEGAALAPIVVSAQRQVQDVQRVPLSLTVLAAPVLRDASLTQPQALTYLIPGLQVGSLPGSTALLFLRGVGNFAFGQQDPTVTMNFDGVYIARSATAAGQFHDLERVEVLKGPQGTLYGRNATGGAVNVLPRRPQLGVRGADLTAGYGTRGSVQADGAVNVPLGERAALRVAGQRVRHDAYMRDGTDDQDDWAGRVALRLEPRGELSLRLAADYFSQGGHGPGATPLELGAGTRAGVSSPDGGAYYTSQRVTIAGRSWDPMPGLQRSENRHRGVNATVDWRTALGTLTLVPAWRATDIDALNTTSGNLFTVREHSRQRSLEARLLSAPGARLSTLVGAFHLAEANDLFTRPFNQFNFSLQRPSQETMSAAGFARLTWHVRDDVRATVGARHTREVKDFRGTFESYSRACPPVPSASCPDAQPFPVDIMSSPIPFPDDLSIAVPVPNPADGSVTSGFRVRADESAAFSRTTWRAALEHGLAPDALLYGSYETGFKSGGFFFSNDSQVYRPEHVGALTLGLKSRLLGNRLQANLELFDWRYRDQQVSKLSLDSRGVTNLRTENVGQASIRGAELDIEHAVAEGSEVTASVQYLRAVYDSYVFQTRGSRPLSGCDVSTTAGAFQVDCSGRRSPYAPEWTTTLGMRTRVAPTGRATAVIHSRLRYQSATLAGLDFLPEQEQSGYWMVDAGVVLSPGPERVSIALLGQNLTNATVVSNTFVVPFGTFVVGTLRAPRTASVRVTTRF